MSSDWISNAIPLTQITYAAASITSSYTVAGNFSSPLMTMMIVSTLDEPVQVSFDGTNDHIPVPAGSEVPVFIPLEFKNNRMTLNPVTVYVKEIGAPTVGSLYVSGFSARIP